MDSNDYRSRYWGAMFPGSSVDIYEWVESYTKPEEGTEYVSEKFYNMKQMFCILSGFIRLPFLYNKS